MVYRQLRGLCVEHFGQGLYPGYFTYGVIYDDRRDS